MMMSSEYLDESDRYSQQQVDDDAAWLAEHASEERYMIEHGEAWLVVDESERMVTNV